MPDTYGDDDLWYRRCRPSRTAAARLTRVTGVLPQQMDDRWLLDSEQKMHAIAEVAADVLARVK